MQNKNAHEDTFSPLPEASFSGSWTVFPLLPVPETPLAAHLAPTSRVFVLNHAVSDLACCTMTGVTNLCLYEEQTLLERKGNSVNSSPRESVGYKEVESIDAKDRKFSSTHVFPSLEG